MKNKILTITLNPCIDKTITIEDFKYGGLNRVLDLRWDAAGKGVNVSKVLNAFLSDVICYTIAAGDGGQKISNELMERGIEAHYTAFDGETRTNIKLFDKKSHITTEINERGFCATDSLVETCIGDIAKLLCQTEIMVLSGSVPEGFDSDIYARLIHLAKEHNVKVIVDADGTKLERAIDEVPYAIKPNIIEFEELCGKKFTSTKDIASAMGELHQKGISLIVVSLGGDGAIFSDGSTVLLAEALEISCKSTVGAGDSMVALMAYAIKNELDLQELARLSVAAGSVTASKEGTGLCTADEVMLRKDEVIIKRLK